MGDVKGYFQFPLCLLRFGKDDKDRLEHIVSYCLCEQVRRTNPNFRGPLAMLHSMRPQLFLASRLDPMTPR